MSISTYAELKTFIQTAVDRADADLPVSAADLITLAESQINRVLPARRNWTSTPLTGMLGSRLVALPSNFVEPWSLMLTTYGAETKLTPFVAGTVELGTTPGTPSEWSILEDNIAFDVPCSQVHTFTLYYRKKFSIASDSTNWLLTNHPDVYVFASLVELWTFLQKPDNAASMYQRLNFATSELARLETRNIAVAPLRPDVMSPMPFNINTG